ncbi:MAG: 2-iminoacetate synthase ThiH [Leptonema illini]|uniref:2-iminoacetate synthase ThiH n=1 Tax=Leptonema illini TaxID=183 RepID=A0A833LY69_9LEPT|nr:MAG: 2-iminoacetate synthase ThiH [Leptonema illini]
MSFLSIIERWHDFDFAGFFRTVDERAVARSLARQRLDETDLLTLLSPAADPFLEEMAQRSHRLTLQHFGRTIQLFIPLYISNFCTNGCTYCGFNHSMPIRRRRLSIAEIDAEARAIAATGMQHILMLTGEAPGITPMGYLREAVACLKEHFASVAIEIFPLDEDGYRQLRQCGADGMTLFQETYDREVYRRVHLAGRKTDYRWRLDAPERAACAGLRSVNIGPLLGLAEPRQDVFFTALHGRWLAGKYPGSEIAFSLPRFNRAGNGFQPATRVDDRLFVQCMTGLRLFLPQAGITMSTRESAPFRDRLLFLGATRYSAFSKTGVGGYAEPEDEGGRQFETTDNRTVDEVAQAISACGCQPVFKDWDAIG